MSTAKKEPEKSQPVPKPVLAMTSKGFAPTDINQAYRYADALSQSSFVPDRYQGKPGDCLIALDLSLRLGVSWMAVMQHVYNVNGRPAMEAALSTALTHKSGLFVDPLEYEVEGIVDDNDYRVRATATRKTTSTVLYGPWISWKLVKAEGWLDKKGSKWKTMPEQMFHYRAAAWFTRRHCPGVTMGMLTIEEAEEIPPRKQVESQTFEQAKESAEKKIKAEQGSEPVETPKEPTKKEKAAATRKANKEKKEAEAKPETEQPAEETEHFYVCEECGVKFDDPRIADVGDAAHPVCSNVRCLSPKIKKLQE